MPTNRAVGWLILTQIVTLQVGFGMAGYTGVVWACIPAEIAGLGCLLWSHHADRYLDWHLRNYLTKRADLYARERWEAYK